MLEVEDFFLSRDKDFDGHLSFEEFLGEESAIEKLFKNMDKNKDGKVSKQVNKNNLLYHSITIMVFQEFMSICTNLSKHQVINNRT